MTRTPSTFDLYGPTESGDIRVGYISTTRGYISNVNLHQANVYAKANPGTTFIFQTRRSIRYLNINQVNQLTPADLTNDVETCSGIETGLTEDSPDIIFLGGGGVGAAANLIVGTDGAILGADMVSGGFGYQYPPLVRIKDPTGIGAGPSAEAILGEIIETVQTYPDEEDFENYNLSGGPNVVGFGSATNAFGQVTGDWNPYKYTNYHKNAFDREVESYQQRLEAYQNPWWTSRTEVPLAVTVAGTTNRTKYNVDHRAWDEFTNSYAISPVPKSNVKGSDYANKWYSFIWDVDVPYDGEYIFRGSADNEGKLYIDNEQVSIYHHNYKGPPVEVKKELTAGTHNIRLDLFNTPVRQLVSRQNFTLQGGSVLEMEDWYDDDWTDLKCFTNVGTFHSINGFSQSNEYGFNRCKFVVQPSSAFPEGSRRPVEFRVTTGTMFINEIEIVGLFTVKGPDITTDTNLHNAIRTQLNERFTNDVVVGTEYDVIVRNHAGVINAEGNLIEPPWIKLRARNLPAPPLPTTSPTTTDIQRRSIFNTIDWIERANRKLWRTNVYSRGGFINDYGVCPFDTTVVLPDNPYSGDHRIAWRNIEFPIAGNYIFEIAVDDNADLYIGPVDNPLVHIHKDGFVKGHSTGTTRVSRAVPRGSHTITVDLHQIPGGAFGFSSAQAAELTNGVRGINPMALAVKIETAFSEREEDIPKSWNENPMGVALAIDAPLPPIPQQPLPEQEGRCPPSPIWTTRFPHGQTSWHPVTFRVWSKFLNKYAMSPIPPLSTTNSDGGGGIPYINKWTINAPYAGFYKLRAEVDDIGSVKVDGDTKISLNSGVVYGETLVQLSEGSHEIEVMAENLRFERMRMIDQEIFNLANWIGGASLPPTTTEVEFHITTASFFINSIEIVGLLFESGPLLESADTSSQRIQLNKKVTKTVEYGRVYEVEVQNVGGVFPSGDTAITPLRLTTSGQMGSSVAQRESQGSSVLRAEDYTDDDFTDIVCGASVGRFFDINGNRAKFMVEGPGIGGQYSHGILTSGTVRDGVQYTGPRLASYKSGPLGPELSPQWKDDEDFRANFMGKIWEMTWTNVNFPVTAEYSFEGLADDVLTVFVDGNKVGEAIVNRGIGRSTFRVSEGKHEIKLTLTNIPGNATSTFWTNPTTAAVKIKTRREVGTGITKPWTVNPIGISVALYPPPCPKTVGGKGTVTEVRMTQPGNGFAPADGPGYPVLLELEDIIVSDGGINYNCAEDTVNIITPSGNHGASAHICGCDNFGRINRVCIDNGGQFTEYPLITINTRTGINFEGTPVFKVVRDPLPAPEPDKLVQVTDLVGLKQTGYYEGRPYYGAVFYKEGVRYAGMYETPGPLIQIYDTLQESIDAEVTTPPSAIQRQGTDISSNDPRLNIPGTPDSLTDN